jgi:acyl CoA:acetate/3-ketoacid CoA transferase alpha subunit
VTGTAETAEKLHCIDCAFLQTRIDLDGGSNYSCVKDLLEPGADILWRTPCGDFDPAPAPEVKPSPRTLPPPALLQPPDVEGFRRFMRDEKDLSLREKVMDEAEAVKRFVKRGDYVGFELYGTVRCPLSIVREIVRQDVGSLRVVGQGLMDVDFLIAAGLVKAMDLTYVGYEAHGLSPVLRRACEKEGLEVVEWSNAGLSWRFKAAAMGVPFLPARSMLGSDTLRRSAAKTMRDPYTGLEVALLPALFLDCAVIHVHRADRYGNCQIDGITGFAPEMSRAAKRLIVTAEEIVEPEVFRRDPGRTTIPFYLVDAVVKAPFGAHPGETSGAYRRDEAGIKEWLEAARTPEGTKAYLDRWVYGLSGHAEYLRTLGTRRLRGLLA